MNKNLFSLLLMMLAVCPGAFAAYINSQEAISLAKQFHPATATSLNSGASNEYRVLYTEKSESGKECVYVISSGASAQSYTVVAASNLVANPILGFSDSDGFDAQDMPENMKWWLSEYARQIEWLESHTTVAAQLPATRAAIPEVAPLLGNIKYNQGNPYNAKCPLLSTGQRCVTGCVATAVSQVMRYYKYPEHGTGSNSYTWNGQTLSADFDSITFDWDNMLPEYSAAITATATKEQLDAVATLMSAVGISCNMGYGLSSGAVTSRAIQAMVANFGYSKNIEVLSHDVTPTAEYDAAVRRSLYASCPVVYTGRTASNAGHAFVVDGCNSEGYFHVNWGWGGKSDGYFLSTVMDPYEHGIGGADAGFDYAQMAFMNIHPAGDNEDDIFTPGYLTANGFEAADTHVARGSSTNFTYTSIFSNAIAPVNYYIGVAITEDNDSVPVADRFITGQWLINYTLNPGYGWNSITRGYTIPRDLENGTYRLYAIFTEKERPDSIRTVGIARANNPYIKLIASDNGFYFDEYNDPEDVTYTIENAADMQSFVCNTIADITVDVMTSSRLTTSEYLSLRLALQNVETDSLFSITDSPEITKTYNSGVQMKYTIKVPATFGFYRLALLNSNDKLLCASDSTYEVSTKPNAAFTLDFITQPSSILAGTDITISGVLQSKPVQTADYYKSLKLALLCPADSSVAAISSAVKVTAKYTTGIGAKYTITTPEKEGEYLIAITDDYDNLLCIATEAKCIVAKNPNLGVNIITEDTPALYATPHTGSVLVHSEDTSSVIIYSISGAVAWRGKISGDMEISLPAGAYILHGISENIITKFVVK